MSNSADRSTKRCPFCGEEILRVAVKCRFCQEVLDDSAPIARKKHRKSSSSASDRFLMPVDRPASAIFAGYLGLLSFIPFVHFLAIGIGFWALSDLNKNRRLIGRGRAWTGIVMGCLFTAIYVIGFIVSKTANPNGRY